MLQLELDLWQQIEQAEAVPEQSDVQQLCLGLEAIMTQVPVEQQLATAGTALLQIVEIFGRRAEVLLNDWRDAHNDEGPILDLDEELDWVRQVMVLDDELMAESEPGTRRNFPGQEGESVVKVVEKEVLLEQLGEELRGVESETALDVVEEEDVSAWVEAIARQLGQGSMTLLELQKHLSLSIGMVWLGALMGDFILEQGDEFYGVAIAVRQA